MNAYAVDGNGSYRVGPFTIDPPIERNGDFGPGASSPTITLLAGIHARFDRWLALSDDENRYDQIDIAMAVVVANRLPSNPLWMFLIAPPSSGKTEVIQSLNLVVDTFLLSSLTPKSFASGYIVEPDAEEPSLLEKLNDKTILMKDFGSVLTMRQDTRDEIYGQLREIYDGAYSKSFGTGKVYDWKGKVGLLAGTTTLIDREAKLNSALGERFIMYRIPLIPARTLARRAIQQQAMNESEQRKRLQEAVSRYLFNFTEPDMREVPEPLIEGVSALAEYVALGRAAVIHDSSGDIDFISQAEAPGRLAQQLTLLLRALAIVRQEATPSRATFNTVARVACDTIPATRQTLLSLLLSCPDGIDCRDAAKATGYSEAMVRRRLQGLVAVKLAVERGRKELTWVASDHLRNLMKDVAGANTYASGK